jgi:ATP-dependent exoDNAse (exonuclease V) beta subunit
VVGDVAHKSPPERGVLIDPQFGILLPQKDEDGRSTALYPLGKQRNEDQSLAESDRLLYVAATRAQEKLILSGCMQLKQGGQPSRLDGWLKKMAAPECLGLEAQVIPHDDTGARVNRLALNIGAGGTPVDVFIYEPEVAWQAETAEQAPADPTLGETPLPPPLLGPVLPDRHLTDERAAQRERTGLPQVWRVVPVAQHARAPAWIIGSLAHEALAAWRFPDAEFDAWVNARAHGYGVTDPAQLGDAIKETRALLTRFSTSALFMEMDGAERRLHEVPYCRMAGEELENGVIDALYLRGGTWTVVEYKTDRVRNAAAFEQLLKEQDYVSQVLRYQAAVAQLVGQRPGVVLCLLNYAGSVRVQRL